MITENYCSSEVVKLLKEKGFDGETHTTFDKEGYTQSSITHQMALKWLREIYKICIVVYPFTHRERGTYTSDICTVTMTMEEGHLRGIWNSYEEAVEESLEYVLEHLI